MVHVKHRSGIDDPPDAEAHTQRIAAILPQLRREIRGLREEVQRLRDEVRTLRGQHDPDRLLDLDETAERLGVSRRTVDTLCAEGAITSIKVRRCRRIPRRALDAYIRRRAEEGRRHE